MERKLPKVYANKIDKDISNNEHVAYNKNSDEEKIVTNKKESDAAKTELKGNISQKLNAIFNSPRYVYKADVEITLKDKKVVKKIVGQNQNYVITMENELIPIADIMDVNFVD